jgi:hypothetical protein
MPLDDGLRPDQRRHRKRPPLMVIVAGDRSTPALFVLAAQSVAVF